MDTFASLISSVADFVSPPPISLSSTKASSSKPTTAAGAAAAKSQSVMTDDGHSMASVDSFAGPEGKITFDIRAAKAKVQEKYNNVLAAQMENQTLSKATETKWQEAPFYDFKERAKLYKAHLKAQAKFNLYKSDAVIQQFHIDYLEALDKSSLSPKQKHEKYAQFQEQAKAAAALKYDVYTLDSCTSGVIKDIESEKSTAISAALDAEKLVQKLLKDIQKPHTELRNNIAQNLRHRDIQLRNPATTEDERATLKADISTIKAFQGVGGLESLPKPEAEQLNRLLEDATTKYNRWQKAPSEESQTIPIDHLNEGGVEMTAFNKPPSQKQVYEQDFKTADTLVMTQIRLLGSRLKGPPELRKDLVDTLKHKEALRGNSNDRVPLDDDIDTLKTFLDSPELAALDSKAPAAQELTRLIQESNQKYGAWHKLETAAKALEAAAKTATDEPSAPQPKDPPKDTPKIPTKKEIAQKKADQAKEDAHAAKATFENADEAVMNKILTLLFPPPSTSSSPLANRLGPPLVTVAPFESNAAVTVFANPTPSHQPPPGPPPKPSSGPLPLTAFSSPASDATAFFNSPLPTQPPEDNLDSLDQSRLSPPLSPPAPPSSSEVAAAVFANPAPL